MTPPNASRATDTPEPPITEARALELAEALLYRWWTDRIVGTDANAPELLYAAQRIAIMRATRSTKPEQSDRCVTCGHKRSAHDHDGPCFHSKGGLPCNCMAFAPSDMPMQ